MAAPDPDQSLKPPISETSSLPSQAPQRVMAVTLRSRRGKSFFLFPKLAKELRDMIFKFAAEDIDPNIVKIYLSNPEDNLNDTQPEIRASYKVPALLKVNRQARYVAKMIYPLIFSRNLCGKQIFFNVSKDILYFEGNPNCARGWQNTLWLFGRTVTLGDMQGSCSDAKTGTDADADARTGAALIQNQVRFIILHPAGHLSRYEARDTLDAGFNNLEGVIIVKDRLRLSGFLQHQARFSPLAIENMMARFWGSEILRRNVVTLVPFNKPRISCLVKAKINKKNILNTFGLVTKDLPTRRSARLEKETHLRF